MWGRLAGLVMGRVLRLVDNQCGKQHVGASASQWGHGPTLSDPYDSHVLRIISHTYRSDLGCHSRMYTSFGVGRSLSTDVSI